MNDLTSSLAKFGSWSKLDNCVCQCPINYYENKIPLNIVFLPQNADDILEYLEKSKISLDRNTKLFYEKFGGLRLFTGSLTFYGIVKEKTHAYLPSDIGKMNAMLRLRNDGWKDSFVSLGHYAEFEFCLDAKRSESSVLVVNRKNMNVVNFFQSLEEVVQYCISKLSPLYSTDGMLISNEKPDRRVWTQNICYKNIF